MIYIYDVHSDDKGVWAAVRPRSRNHDISIVGSSSKMKSGTWCNFTLEVLEDLEDGDLLSVGDGIARIYGLEKAMSGELLEFEDGTLGIALNLEANNVGAVLLGDGLKITEGSRVRCTGKIAEIPVGEAYLGRVVDALARPVDGNGAVPTTDSRAIESPAPGIISRRSVYVTISTGLVAVDAMIPIGRGQRELIIGDRQTGKTAIAVDTILNQKGKGVICVYVAIGQKASSVAQVLNTLKERGALDYTIIVMANANEPATLQ